MGTHISEGLIIEGVTPELGVVDIMQADVGVVSHLGEDLRHIPHAHDVGVPGVQEQIIGHPHLRLYFIELFMHIPLQHRMQRR